MEYEERLKILNWPSLEKRRHFISFVECYSLNGLNFSDFFELALVSRTRANHSFKLFVKSAKVNPTNIHFCSHSKGLELVQPTTASASYPVAL